MIKREEVEAILAETNAYTGRHAGIVAELCRTWLRVNDAPVGVVDSFVLGRWSVEKCNMAHFTTLKGKTIRLVPEADSGGEGNGYWPELPKNGGHDWTGHD